MRVSIVILVVQFGGTCLTCQEEDSRQDGGMLVKLVPPKMATRGWRLCDLFQPTCLTRRFASSLSDGKRLGICCMLSFFGLGLRGISLARLFADLSARVKGYFLFQPHRGLACTLILRWLSAMETCSRRPRGPARTWNGCCCSCG